MTDSLVSTPAPAWAFVFPFLLIMIGCEQTKAAPGAAASGSSDRPAAGSCRDSEADCKAFGRCSGTLGDCKASSDEDCRKSAVCAQSGWCVAKEGQCVLPEDGGGDRCQTQRCREYGECTPRGSLCVIGSDADCAGAGICRRGGQCTARGGKCVIGSQQDCAKSERCTRFGFCRYENGTCGK
jgi:hypothetical protein